MRNAQTLCKLMCEHTVAFPDFQKRNSEKYCQEYSQPAESEIEAEKHENPGLVVT